MHGLDIQVQGAIACGISNRAGNVTLHDGNIRVTGSRLAYGIVAENKISLYNSSAEVLSPAGAALLGGNQVTYDEDTFVTGPDTENKLPFYVTGMETAPYPVAVRINTAVEDIPFSDEVGLKLRHVGGSAVNYRTVPIKEWDTPALFTGKAGIHRIEGRLSEEALREAGASNALGIKAFQRVNVIDETGTFIDAIKFDPDRDVHLEENISWIHVWCPRPGEDSTALYLEYSRDGNEWVMCEWEEGEYNWLEDWYVNSWADEEGRVILDAKIPYIDGTFKVRLRTVGGVYDGTGHAAVVNVDEGKVTDVWNPGSEDDGSGGDRGGGTVEPGESPKEEERPEEEGGSEEEYGGEGVAGGNIPGGEGWNNGENRSGAEREVDGSGGMGLSIDPGQTVDGAAKSMELPAQAYQAEQKNQEKPQNEKPQNRKPSESQSENQKLSGGKISKDGSGTDVLPGPRGMEDMSRNQYPPAKPVFTAFILAGTLGTCVWMIKFVSKKMT